MHVTTKLINVFQGHLSQWPEFFSHLIRVSFQGNFPKCLLDLFFIRIRGHNIGWHLEDLAVVIELAVLKQRHLWAGVVPKVFLMLLTFLFVFFFFYFKATEAFSFKFFAPLTKKKYSYEQEVIQKNVH